MKSNESLNQNESKKTKISLFQRTIHVVCYKNTTSFNASTVTHCQNYTHHLIYFQVLNFALLIPCEETLRRAEAASWQHFFSDACLDGYI